MASENGEDAYHVQAEGTVKGSYKRKKKRNVKVSYLSDFTINHNNRRAARAAERNA